MTDTKPPRKKESPPGAPGLDTRAVRGAAEPDYNAGAVVPPIYQTSTFHFPAELSEARSQGTVHLYTRLGNPTLTQAAQAIASLEGAEQGRVYASGMGAISSVLLSTLRSGDEVVALENLYGNSVTFLRDVLPRWGIHVLLVPEEESSEVARSVTDRTKLLFLESPTNPTLRVHDLSAWAKAAEDAGAFLLVDNTFATPVNQNPLALGAHVVMHSATKYLSGHSDLIAGALVGKAEVLAQTANLSETLGATLDPMAAFLLLRGMKTLGVRVRQHNHNAEAVVEEFSSHPKITNVLYPGRFSEKEEELARRQMRGRGGMVSLVVKGGLPAAHRFLANLRVIHPASSLGGVESLASLPAETSHRQLSAEERARRGIDDGMIRLSIGIEDAADLVADIRHALDQS